MTMSADTHSHPGPKLYAMILGALLMLTVITVGAAYIDFGSMNTVIALVIASVKASLVALFFMHLKNDKFNALLFVGGVFFLGVFLIFTLFDIEHRVPLYPGNLKAPIQEFPGAPLNGRMTPSNGMQFEFNKAPAPAKPVAPAPKPAAEHH
jgi:cytochrome c oxidase subunit IV